MKRFHLHMHVTDLSENLRFYSALFATEPTRVESDYAKWMLEDPPINFAISTRGKSSGIDHLGFQTDDALQLPQMMAQAVAADKAMLDEGTGTCCYARSTKHWVTDPQGVAWEQFHTLDSIPTFNEASATANLMNNMPLVTESIDSGATNSGSACCAPRSTTDVIPVAKKASACC